MVILFVVTVIAVRAVRRRVLQRQLRKRVRILYSLYLGTLRKNLNRCLRRIFRLPLAD